jgi:acyl-CoA synthetase (AMP-forming)/AMP-acid ligase II
MKGFSILARSRSTTPQMSGTSELVERFDRVRRVAPDRRLVYLPAVGAASTADDLWRTHLRLRAALKRCGLGVNDLVVSAAANRPVALPLLLACLSEQIALMPVDAGTTRTEIDALVSQFQASAAILPGHEDGPGIPLHGGLLIVRPPRAPSGNALPGGVALLKLTSGSTGQPKATLTAESHLIRDAERIIEGMGIAASDSQIAAIPLSHSYGLGNLVLPLLLQGTPMVLRDAFLPQQLAADARLVGARILPGAPFMFEHFAAHPPAGGWPASLHLLISAGARLHGETIGRFRDQFGQAIHSFYGSSETGGIAFNECDDQADAGCVGRPLRGVTLAFRSQEGAPAASGRVHVCSDAVACGYAGEGAATGPFVDGGFLTGDIGHLDERGRVVLTGRLSSFVNVAGRKVQPEEVERALLAMPGVAHACVVGVPDLRRGQRIGACLVARERITLVEIRRFCAARLSPHKIPRTVLLLERMPVTARGKVDRARVEQMIRDSIAEGG